MKSIAYPNMFNTTSTREVTDHAATVQNLKLLLLSEKGELLGDPYYGIRIKKYMFEQNSYVLKDVIIDEIYQQIAQFMPQLVVDRKNITITQDRAKIYVNIKGLNLLDYTTDLFNLVLFDEEEQ